MPHVDLVEFTDPACPFAYSAEPIRWRGIGSWAVDYDAPDHVWGHLDFSNGMHVMAETSISYGHVCANRLMAYRYDIIGTDGVSANDIIWWGKGVEKAPLIGRTFRHGVTDCYSLIKDYYEIEKGIVLPEFPRDWEWWKQGEQNLFEQGFTKAGFVRIDASEAKPGDVWLARIG